MTSNMTTSISEISICDLQLYTLNSGDSAVLFISKTIPETSTSIHKHTWYVLKECNNMTIFDSDTYLRLIKNNLIIVLNRDRELITFLGREGDYFKYVLSKVGNKGDDEKGTLIKIKSITILSSKSVEPSKQNLQSFAPCFSEEPSKGVQIQQNNLINNKKKPQPCIIL